jgi:hypothetical protein
LLPIDAKNGANAYEERVVRILASNVVRQRGPEEPATDVEQRKQAGEASRDRSDLHALIRGQCVELHARLTDQVARKDLLQHGRCHANHADAGRHIEAKHPPDQPELRRLVRIFEIHVIL